MWSKRVDMGGKLRRK